MSDATTLSPSQRPAWSATTVAERAVLGVLLVSVAATSWYLLAFWRESPELSHGYFAPFCFAALLWQSRQERDFSSRISARVVSLFGTLLLLAGLVLAVITALAALAQGPFHTQTGFLAGLVAGIFSLSAVLVLARSPAQTVRLNGASLCAALLWCFVVPLPSGTLARFTLFLQDMITAGSLHAVHLFGFPATRDGNIIRLPNTLVGVEEACSGIRSLTACLFAGVVLGGLMLRGLPKRIFIFVGAGVIAVIANFFRSITLCLLAAHGVEIKGFWHDATAYAVLGLTALVLFGGCLLLCPKRETTAPRTVPIGVGHRPALLAHALLSGAIGVLLLLVILKIAPAPARERPPPDLQSLLVMEQPGWIRRTDESIFAFGAALNTSHLRSETYRRDEGAGSFTQLTFYVAFWPSRQSTLGSVALHTPEICLPGSGWTVTPLPAAANRYPLPSPRRFAFAKQEYPQHIWFWHYFDGHPVLEPAGLYPWQLGPLLLKSSVSSRAPQWVVRVSSNRPLESLQDEPIVQEFFTRLHATGLAASTPAT